MAQIQKMQIQGIRSFGPTPDDRQNIEFFSPLTLILGQNGCGKTTIIECLKYVCTGDVPPGSSRGASFVHDPKFAKEACVKGQVKLQFHTTGINAGTQMKIICRSIEAAQKLKNITTKTLDSTITSRHPDGNTSQLSSKCADINLEMNHCLGVSRPILNYVIFCHQEDSNWPLEEGSKVKEKFDEIFNSAKYQKCLKNIKDVRKAEMDKAKFDKKDMEHFKSDKEYAESKEKELKKKKNDIESVQSAIDKIKDEIKPIIEEIRKVEKQEEGFGDKQKKLAEAETSYNHVKKEKDVLESQILEVLPDTVENSEIERKKNGIEEETKLKESEIKDLEKVIHENDQNLSRRERGLQKNAARIGQALEEKKQHERNKDDKNKLVESAVEELDLVDDGNFSSVLFTEEKRIDGQINNLKSKNKELESRIEDEIDQLKAKKTGFEERKKREQAELMSSKKEIALLKRQLNELEGAADKLNRIKKEWEQAETSLEKEKKKHDLKALAEEIDLEKQTIKGLEIDERKIKEERNGLEEKQGILQKINHLEEDLKQKKAKIEKLLKKRTNEFLELFEIVPDIKRLRQMWKGKEETTEKRLKELESSRANLEAELNSKRNLRKDTLKTKEKKSTRKQVLEGKIGEYLAPDQDLDEEILKLQENLELSRKELQVKEAGKFTYREMIEKMMNMRDSPACPTCNRAFNKKQEADELISDLEELISTIPGKVKSLEVKKKNLEKKLEQLQSIRPEAHELKTVSKEIEDNVKKLETMDNELKQIQKKLEDGEEDLSITEVSSSLLKQVNEDVQLLDSLNKEVIDLQERKDELSLQLDGEVGRNIDVVRQEEEDICQKIRVARKNLDQCQETVSSQTALINDLEAKKNKLTEKKLEIEGQQQQQANMLEKKQELEKKVTKSDEEIKKCDQSLEPVKAELSEAEDRKRRQVQAGDAEVQTLFKRLRNVEKHQITLKKLEENIQMYIDAEKENEVERLKKEKNELEEEIKVIKEDKKATEQKIGKLKVEVSNQESRKRMYDDNIRLREYIEKEARMNRQVAKYKQELEDADWSSVVAKKEKLLRQHTQMSSEKSGKEGQVAEISRTIREMERELNQAKWKNAASMYKEKAIKHKLRLKVAEDLDKYYRALDTAITKYHKEKMKVINKIIREMWKSTYKGNDIDYIEIKTTEDNQVSGGADKRKTYNYRVVMIKSETEMDMRGRCSAGQKVLSSLIIRLALAETFSLNCGIIALDEPTTNLDRENIESLATALTEIVNKRAAQRNFQLVVITHDEEFIEQLSRCDKIQYYQEVSRSAKGLSQVRKRNVATLEVQN